MNEPKGVHVNFVSDPVYVVYTFINIRKIKIIAYMYNCFNENFNEKPYISSKIESVKHLHTVFC